MSSLLARATAILAPYLPPVVHRALSDRAYPNIYSGDFRSWSEALKSAEGYDSGAILERVREAARKVARGEARAERDSVMFDEVPHSYPVLAALLRAALMNEGVLHVLDFGGSLGSSYHHFRAFTPRLRRLEWSVVEQPHFVACGRAEFENQHLRFYESVAECLRERTADVLLLSSVLSYLPDPYAFVDQFIACGFRSVIVDRTLFRAAGEDRLCVQRVPPHIYPASYPAWLLSRTKFLSRLAARYERLVEFQAEHIRDFERVGARCVGFIFDRRA
jgi:putative methyltransferase (TIGR04325 family)